MKSNELTKKRRTLNLANFFMLLILSGFLFSCNWNSSEKRNSAKAESDLESKITTKDSSYIVDVTAVDYAFGMPTEIPSGWVTFRMKNMGKEEHLGIVEKYPDSLGYDGLIAMISNALEEDGMEGFYPLLELREGQFGGPAMLSPNLTGETTVFLEPGLYAFTCWVKTPEGDLHLQKGMIRPFKITNEETGADKPTGTVDITMSDFAINIEDSIAAGDHIFNVNFENPHNVHMAKLEEGDDLEELKQWMTHVTAPSPFRFIGGAEQAPEGMSSTFKATLEPGRYAFLTFGRTMYGMVEEINITKDGAASPTSAQVVNPVIKIESGFEGTNLPEKMNIGRTPIIVKNTGKEKYAYNLVLLKEGKSVGEVENFFKAVYVDKTINFQIAPKPFQHIYSKVIEPGAEDEFKLIVEKGHYVFIGPVSMKGTEESAFSKNNLYHPIEGVRNTSLK